MLVLGCGFPVCYRPCRLVARALWLKLDHGLPWSGLLVSRGPWMSPELARPRLELGDCNPQG